MYVLPGGAQVSVALIQGGFDAKCDRAGVLQALWAVPSTLEGKTRRKHSNTAQREKKRKRKRKKQKKQKKKKKQKAPPFGHRPITKLLLNRENCWPVVFPIY